MAQSRQLSQVIARPVEVLFVIGFVGPVGVATGTGPTITAAQQSAYALARRVYVPNLRYRIDIGDAFRDRGQHVLRTLGYLTP